MDLSPHILRAAAMLRQDPRLGVRAATSRWGKSPRPSFVLNVINTC